MLEIVLIPVLAAHLAAMHVATAAPLVCIWLKRREVRQADEAAGRLGRFLAWQSILGLLVGTVLGLLAVGLFWLGDQTSFFEALAVVPRRRLWFGLVELLFFVGLMLWYAGVWNRVRRPTLWHPSLALLAATDLIYHFPPLFAAVTVLQNHGSVPEAELSYTEFLKVLFAPESLARVLHFLLASAAVTGVVIMSYALRRARREDAAAGRVLVWGGRISLVPSVLQLLSGIYLLFSLPREEQQRLMGGDWLATGLLAISGVAVVALLHSLSALSLGEAGRREAQRSLWLMALVVLSMTAVRCVS